MGIPTLRNLKRGRYSLGPRLVSPVVVWTTDRPQARTLHIQPDVRELNGTFIEETLSTDLPRKVSSRNLGTIIFYS